MSMINDNGIPVPPPNGDAETLVLENIWAHVQDVTASRWRPHLRTRRSRVGACVVVTLALFGGGVAVGGFALTPLGDASPAFTVACYPSQSADETTVRLAYATEMDAAVARHDPIEACAHVQTETNIEDGIDTLVRQQVSNGHTCGTIHLTDGTTWSFVDDPKNGLTIESSAPVPPLAADCIQLRDIRPVTPSTPEQFACTVNDHLVNVYPGDSKSAGSVCASKGLSVSG